MEKEIYKKIKENEIIILARHIGPDPDALGSTIGLKDIIKATFPKKEVFVIGASTSKFKYIGNVDKVDKSIFKDALLIVCDTPDLKRIDGVNDISDFKDVIKIDHHPEIDQFGSIRWVDDTKSSVCQMIMELIYNTKLKMTKYAAEKLFMGLVSDTNRFLFYYTTADTMRIVSKMIDDTHINFTALYDDLYRRPLSEIRLQGYMYQNLIVTENGLGYIKLTDEIIRSFDVDPASSGNLVNNFNNIDEVLVWVTFSEDVKQDQIRVNVRSRGPIINKVLERHNGGGHKYASGARIKTFEEMESIINDLDEVCLNYKKENKIK
ncbi:MAG: bifunctional oligoribonuclease/PAP phosphatase NrnA [Bacilli bacterium]|nr:bifunctional oligoribonuclease/PAP phosphatase NrnA [Bacilli bacterium]